MTITKGTFETQDAQQKFEVQGGSGEQAALQTALKTTYSVASGPVEIRAMVMCNAGYSGVGCTVKISDVCPNGAVRSGPGMMMYDCQ
jgi:hypothetical protein